MDYFAATAAQRNTYLDSPPEADSSSSSTPDNITNCMRFSSLDSRLFAPDQTWDPIDLTAFNKMTDLHNPFFRQTSLHPPSDSDQTTIPHSKVRRRAQNRASQRAFRERKERHVKGLETQLELLNEKHQDLLCSYHKQSDSIGKLNRKVARLAGDLKVLKASTIEEEGLLLEASTLGGNFGGGGGGDGQRLRAVPQQQQGKVSLSYTGGCPVMPDKFDAFSSVEALTALYDGYELGLVGTIVNTANDAAAPAALTGTGVGDIARRLPEFEDLLRLA